MMSTNRTKGRPGAIVAMVGLMMVFIIILMALAVDISWVVLTGMDLQNAADAAALAGSDKLLDNWVLYNMHHQSAEQKEYIRSQAMTNARILAKEFAAKNGAGGVSSLVLLDQDIEFGLMNENYEYLSIPPYVGYPNTIRVHIRRDDVANTPLKLFFARAPLTPYAGNRGTLLASVSPFTGMRVGLNRAATASLNGGIINSFKTGTEALSVLPMTLDETVWNAYLTAGVDPYGNKARVDELGNRTFEIYSLYKDKGNFGELSLDGSHAGTNETISWIDYGLRTTDVQSLLNLNLLPVSPNHNTWNWLGNPGFKASVVMEVNSFSSVIAVNNYSSNLQFKWSDSGYVEKHYIGKVFLLPIFKAKDASVANYQAGVGQGSKYYYNIVQFVGVRIMPTMNPNKEIVVQPAPFIDIQGCFQQAAKPIVPPTEDSPVITTFSPSTITR